MPASRDEILTTPGKSAYRTFGLGRKSKFPVAVDQALAKPRSWTEKKCSLSGLLEFRHRFRVLRIVRVELVCTLIGLFSGGQFALPLVGDAQIEPVDRHLRLVLDRVAQPPKGLAIVTGKQRFVAPLTLQDC